MNQISTRTLLLLFFYSSLVVATNFGQCLEDLKKDPDAVGGVDSWGNPTSPAAAVGFTYKTCTERCGSRPVPPNWKDFSQRFPSWLLPWLALVSQLPFGAENYIDNFFSIVISVGSPALAAYSLILTALNARSVNRRVNRIEYKNKMDVARALISLQQMSLELTKDPVFLASIPIDNQWEQEVVSRLSRRNTWSLATASSVAWVIIAFLFTLINSFISLNVPSDSVGDSIANRSGGNAIGTLWLWSLCLVIGWMWVPTFTRDELTSALKYANQKAAKGVAERIRRTRQRAAQTRNPTNAEVTDEPQETNVLRGSGEHNIEVAEDDERVEEGSVQEACKHAEQEANEKADPLPTTGSFRLVSGDQRNHNNLDDSESQTSTQNSASRARTGGETHDWIQPAVGELLIPKGPSSLNRDEPRCAAVFNYARAIRYLALVEDVSRMFDGNFQDNDTERRPISPVPVFPFTGGAVFPPGALVSMFAASMFGLVLQFGITSAAAIIMIFSPTIGLGCHSLGYILHGTNSLVIMYLTIASTILARISETRRESSSAVKDSAARLAIFLRRFCFSLALFNAVGLVTMSMFYFVNLLNNCYCKASVISRGKGSFLTISYYDWIPTIRSAREVGIILAGVTMAVYMLSLWLLTALPSDIDHL